MSFNLFKRKKETREIIVEKEKDVTVSINIRYIYKAKSGECKNPFYDRKVTLGKY